MAPEEKRFNSYITRECYFIYKKNKKTKSHESVFESLSKNKTHETKVPRPATKEDKYCFFMIAKSLADG